MSESNEQARWRGRPGLAWVVRVGIFVVPFLVAMVVAFLLSARLPVADALPVRIVRWIGIVAVSTVAMMGVDRLARRLLPLSVLLKLTLVFPDQAPSRFGVAMRTGTTAQLRKRIDEARTSPHGETPQEAAERLLELVGLLSHHDRLTRGHSERVRAYCHLVGEELGLTESELDKLRWAGLLHDVGKTAIDTNILNKPGRLTDDEFETIKTHPDEGRALVAPLVDWLGESVRAVWEHHENFDGTGYPRGLAGVDISHAARIVTVADSYDVMTSARSYKQPMSAEAARAELAACSGTQFDPVIVRAFLNISLGRLRMMNGPLAWFAQLALFEPSGVVHAGAASAQTGGTSVAGGTASVASGTGSAVASTGASSTVASVAASAGSAGLTSTVATTTASVLVSTAGMVAGGAALPATVAATPAVTIESEANVADFELGAPGDTVLVVEDGEVTFARSAPSLDAATGELESGSDDNAAGGGEDGASSTPGQPVAPAATDGSVGDDDAGDGSPVSTVSPTSTTTSTASTGIGATPATTSSTVPEATAGTDSGPTTTENTKPATTIPAPATTEPPNNANANANANANGGNANNENGNANNGNGNANNGNGNANNGNGNGNGNGNNGNGNGNNGNGNNGNGNNGNGNAATTTTAAPTTTTTTIPPTTTTTTTTTTTVPPTTTTTTTTTTAPTTTTTTTPPATTTTAPPAAAAAAPPPTTTTTTVPAPATTPGNFLYLGTDGMTGDTTALAFYGITSNDRPDIALPNYDTNRDSAPGALVEQGSFGLNTWDSSKVLKFTAFMSSTLVIDGKADIELYAAAKDFAKEDIEVEVGIYKCGFLGICTLLASDTQEYKNADEWKKKKFHLHDIDTTIFAGQRLEVRVAVDNSSDADGWFAFGTDDYDSHIEIENDD